MQACDVRNGFAVCSFQDSGVPGCFSLAHVRSYDQAEVETE